MKQEKNALATFPDTDIKKKRAGESDEKGRKEQRSMWGFSFSLPLQNYHRSSVQQNNGPMPAFPLLDIHVLGGCEGGERRFPPRGVPEELGPLWELLTRSVFQPWKYVTSRRSPPPVAIWTVQPTGQGCTSAWARECILQSTSTGSQFAFVIDGYARDQILQRLRTRMWLYAANVIQPRQIPAGSRAWNGNGKPVTAGHI